MGVGAATAGLLITLAVFVPFAMLDSRQLDFVWAGLCLLGAVYFMFRS